MFTGFAGSCKTVKMLFFREPCYNWLSGAHDCYLGSCGYRLILLSGMAWISTGHVMTTRQDVGGDRYLDWDGKQAPLISTSADPVILHRRVGVRLASRSVQAVSMYTTMIITGTSAFVIGPAVLSPASRPQARGARRPNRPTSFGLAG